MISDRIFVYPTDTVWGLGAPIYSQKAHQRIAQIKGSAETKSLSLLFAGLEGLKSFIKLPADHDDGFWQNLFSREVTMLFPKSFCLKPIPSWISTSELIGVRMVASVETEELVKLAGGPVSTTSVNLKGQRPAENFEQVCTFIRSQNLASEVDVIKPIFMQPSGINSTIIHWKSASEFSMVREGARANELRALLG